MLERIWLVYKVLLDFCFILLLQTNRTPHLELSFQLANMVENLGSNPYSALLRK